ncbi:MAG: hypothetical protein ABI946_11845 [Chthoniobacterales bacterium]
MVARENGGRVRDLLVALFDQLLEKLRAGPKTRVDLCVGVVAIRPPNDKIGDALQEGQERDEREKQPAPETAKVKPQG